MVFLIFFHGNSLNKTANKIVLIQFVIFVAFFLIPDNFFFIHNKISHYHEKIRISKEKNNQEKKGDESGKEKIENKEQEEKSISVFINYEQGENIKLQKKTRSNKYKHMYQICLNPCYIFSIWGKSSLFF